MPRSSERGHPRTARRFHSPSRRGVTGSQPHARNSTVASLRLTRLPEPRSRIPPLHFLLRHRRPSFQVRQSRITDVRAPRLTRVCAQHSLASHLPFSLDRRVARPAQQAARCARTSFSTHPPSHTPDALPHIGLRKPATGRRPCARIQSVGHPPRLRGPTRGIPRESFVLWLERRIGVHRPPRHTRGRARPTVRVASHNPFQGGLHKTI